MIIQAERDKALGSGGMERRALIGVQPAGGDYSGDKIKETIFLFLLFWEWIVP